MFFQDWHLWRIQFVKVHNCVPPKPSLRLQSLGMTFLAITIKQIPTAVSESDGFLTIGGYIETLYLCSTVTVQTVINQNGSTHLSVVWSWIRWKCLYRPFKTFVRQSRCISLILDCQICHFTVIFSEVSAGSEGRCWAYQSPSKLAFKVFFYNIYSWLTKQLTKFKLVKQNQNQKPP